MRARHLRTWLAATAIGVSFTVPIEAQTPPPNSLLKRTEALQEQAVARLGKEVEAALVEADEYVKTSKPRAIGRVRSMIQQIDRETLLTPAQKSALLQPLQSKLKILEGRAVEGEQSEPKPNQPTKPDPAAPPTLGQMKTERMERLNAEKAEYAQVKKAVLEIEEAFTQGRAYDANLKIAALVKAYPRNIAVNALTLNLSMNQRLEESKKLIAEKEKRILVAFNDIERANMPPLGDYELPKDWASKKPFNPYPTTEKEKMILRSLDSVISVNFNQAPFEEVIQKLSDEMKQPIIVDAPALKEAQVESNTPVTAGLTGVKARSVLRKVLQDLDLTYVVRNETILVTSRQRAQGMLVTRAYYIGDIVQGFDPLTTQANVQQLIDSIRGSIDPASWSDRNGLGSITYNPTLQALIVRQSAEIHSVLSSTFYSRGKR